MACIYKRKKVWWISFLKDGKQKQRSLKTRDKSVATYLKKKIEVELKEGVHQHTSQISIPAYFEVYKQTLNYRKKSTNTAQLSRAKEFVAQTNKKTLNGINDKDIERFMRRFNEKKPKTYNNVIGTLRRFFQPAVDKGYILRNPMITYKKKSVPKNPPSFFSDEEYMKIEKAAWGDPIYPMIVTARYTGLRLRELTHLEWQDFDWTKQQLRVKNKPEIGFTVKNNHAREVPICTELKDKLLPYIQKKGLCFPVPDGPNKGNVYNHEGPRRAINRILKEAGVKDYRVGWHKFRHTFASRLSEKKVDLYLISKWLGHSSIVVTEIYAHHTPQYNPEIEKLNIGSEKNDLVRDIRTLKSTQLII